jgi:hypothetical protein
VTVTVDGAPVAVAVLAIVAVAVVALSAAGVAVVVLLIRAEQKPLVAWQARKAGAR